jgi:hypothetical protein
MYDNYDFFERNAKALHLMIYAKDDGKGRVTASFHPDGAPEDLLSGSFQFLSKASLENPIAVSAERGGEVSKFARMLANFSPEMFNKFESEYLHLSPAIKYNCKKKIWPLRIEDINGKVLWHR